MGQYDFPASAARPAHGGKVLTREQAAAMLCLKPQTLAAWACHGGNGLGFLRIGGRARYYESDVLAFLEAGYRAPTPTPAVAAPVGASTK